MPADASADPTEVLIERPRPFDVPLTDPEPEAYVAASAPGSNGTVHYLVSTRFSWYYVWANASTGATIERLNLTNLGFQAVEFASSPASPEWRMTAIFESGGHVVIARGSQNAIVDIVFFDEGQANNAVAHKLLLPVPSISSATLSGLALARNGSDPLRPSLIFTRTGTSTDYYSFPATDVGEIPLNLNSRAAPVARIVGVIQNFTNYDYNSYYALPIADAWREESFSQPIAAAISSGGERWVFLYGWEYVCTYEYSYGYCYSYTYNLSFISYSPAGAKATLETLTSYSSYYYYYNALYSRLSAAPAPDGSVACAMATPDYYGYGRVVWARASAGAVTVKNVSIGFDVVTGADLAFEGSEARFVVIGLANGTGSWPVMEAYAYTGWPSTPVEALIGRGTQPLERTVVLQSTSSEVLLAGGVLRQRMTTGEGGNKSAMIGVLYAGGWPVVSSVSSAGATYTSVRGWQTPAFAPVVSSALITLADGSRVGALAVMENGTGTVRIFAATGTPPVFRLFEPVAGLDAPVFAVKAIPLGDRALIVVQVLRSYFAQSSYNNYYNTGYQMLLADNQGNVSGPFSVYGSATRLNDTLGLMEWSLSEASPRPLLFTSLGLFVLDPWNGTASHRIELRDDSYYYYSQNWSKILNNYDYIPPPSVYTYYGNCVSYYGYYCGRPTAWWSENGHYYAAFVYSNYSYGSTSYYCNCTLKLRVIDWRPDDTVNRVEVQLNTGSSNDSLYFTPYGDVTHIQEGSTHVLVASVTQTYVWDRHFRATFTSSSLNLSAATLVRETPRPGVSYLSDRLQAVGDSSVAMQTREQGSFTYYGYAITLVEAIKINGTGTRSLAFANVSLTCEWYYWYYYPYYYPYYYYYGCPRWSGTSWGGESAFLVVKAGSIRFFAVNHAPTAPRLESPADGSLVTSNLVNLRASQSVDPDNDPLTYRFDVFDAAGNRVQRVETPANTLTVNIPDGTFHWTCSVSDGVLRVDCIGNFSMRLDGTPPRADAGGPYQIHAGDGVLLNGSNSYDANGIEFYLWTVGSAADFFQNGSDTRYSLRWGDLSPLFQRSSMIPVTLLVRDGSGLTAESHTWIQLLDDPVVIEIVVLSPVLAEGQMIDLGANLTWGSIHASWVESRDSPAGFALLWRLPFGHGGGGLHASFFAEDNTEFDVELDAQAREGGLGSATLHLRIINLAPSATKEGPDQLAEHEQGILRINATDPSPVDARNLTVEWTAEGGVSVAPLDGMRAQVTGVSNGQARVYATVRDKDGGAVVVEFPMLIGQAADPARGLYVASVGSTWVELRWVATEEPDFLRYEVTVFNETGAKLRTLSVPGSRATASFIVDGLNPSTLYGFDLVVVAVGDVRSPAVHAAGTTAPAEVQELPPSEETPPTNTPPQRPNVTNSATPVSTVGTGGADAVLWLIFAVLAGLAGAMYIMMVSRRRRDSDR